jgi:hypothetical protein
MHLSLASSDTGTGRAGVACRKLHPEFHNQESLQWSESRVSTTCTLYERQARLSSSLFYVYQTGKEFCLDAPGGLSKIKDSIENLAHPRITRI